MAVAEKIRLSVAQPLQLGESTVTASVSIGVSLARVGDDVEAIVRRADDAVYLAKERVATAWRPSTRGILGGDVGGVSRRRVSP